MPRQHVTSASAQSRSGRTSPASSARLGRFARSRRYLPLPQRLESSSFGNFSRGIDLALSGRRVTFRQEKEEPTMEEDTLVVAGVLLASAVCGWYVVQSIRDIALLVPADDLCTTAAQCLQLALGY
jgi:hypothetical protein